MEPDTIDLTDPIKEIIRRSTLTRECFNNQLSNLVKENKKGARSHENVSLNDLLKDVPYKSWISKPNESIETIVLSDDDDNDVTAVNTYNEDNVTEVQVIEISDHSGDESSLSSDDQWSVCEDNISTSPSDGRKLVVSTEPPSKNIPQEELIREQIKTAPLTAPLRYPQIEDNAISTEIDVVQTSISNLSNLISKIHERNQITYLPTSLKNVSFESKTLRYGIHVKPNDFITETQHSKANEGKTIHDFPSEQTFQSENETRGNNSSNNCNISEKKGMKSSNIDTYNPLNESIVENPTELIAFNKTPNKIFINEEISEEEEDFMKSVEEILYSEGISNTIEEIEKDGNSNIHEENSSQLHEQALKKSVQISLATQDIKTVEIQTRNVDCWKNDSSSNHEVVQQANENANSDNVNLILNRSEIYFNSPKIDDIDKNEKLKDLEEELKLGNDAGKNVSVQLEENVTTTSSLEEPRCIETIRIRLYDDEKKLKGHTDEGKMEVDLPKGKLNCHRQYNFEERNLHNPVEVNNISEEKLEKSDMLNVCLTNTASSSEISDDICKNEASADDTTTDEVEDINANGSQENKLESLEVVKEYSTEGKNIYKSLQSKETISFSLNEENNSSVGKKGVTQTNILEDVPKCEAAEVDEISLSFIHKDSEEHKLGINNAANNIFEVGNVTPKQTTEKILKKLEPESKSGIEEINSDSSKSEESSLHIEMEVLVQEGELLENPLNNDLFSCKKNGEYEPKSQHIENNPNEETLEYVNIASVLNKDEIIHSCETSKSEEANIVSEYIERHGPGQETHIQITGDVDTLGIEHTKFKPACELEDKITSHQNANIVELGLELNHLNSDRCELNENILGHPRIEKTEKSELNFASSIVSIDKVPKMASPHKKGDKIKIHCSTSTKCEESCNTADVAKCDEATKKQKPDINASTMEIEVPLASMPEEKSENAFKLHHMNPNIDSSYIQKLDQTKEKLSDELLEVAIDGVPQYPESSKDSLLEKKGNSGSVEKMHNNDIFESKKHATFEESIENNSLNYAKSESKEKIEFINKDYKKSILNNESVAEKKDDQFFSESEASNYAKSESIEKIELINKDCEKSILNSESLAEKKDDQFFSESEVSNYAKSESKENIEFINKDCTEYKNEIDYMESGREEVLEKETQPAAIIDYGHTVHIQKQILELEQPKKLKHCLQTNLVSHKYVANTDIIERVNEEVQLEEHTMSLHEKKGNSDQETHKHNVIAFKTKDNATFGEVEVEELESDKIEIDNISNDGVFKKKLEAEPEANSNDAVRLRLEYTESKEKSGKSDLPKFALVMNSEETHRAYQSGESNLGQKIHHIDSESEKRGNTMNEKIIENLKNVSDDPVVCENEIAAIKNPETTELDTYHVKICNDAFRINENKVEHDKQHGTVENSKLVNYAYLTDTDAVGEIDKFDKCTVQQFKDPGLSLPHEAWNIDDSLKSENHSTFDDERVEDKYFVENNSVLGDKCAAKTKQELESANDLSVENSDEIRNIIIHQEPHSGQTQELSKDKEILNVTQSNRLFGKQLLEELNLDSVHRKNLEPDTYRFKNRQDTAEHAECVRSGDDVRINELATHQLLENLTAQELKEKPKPEMSFSGNTISNSTPNSKGIITEPVISEKTLPKLEFIDYSCNEGNSNKTESHLCEVKEGTIEEKKLQLFIDRSDENCDKAFVSRELNSARESSEHASLNSFDYMCSTSLEEIEKEPTSLLYVSSEGKYVDVKKPIIVSPCRQNSDSKHVARYDEKQKKEEVMKCVDKTCHDFSDIIEDMPVNEVPQLGLDFMSPCEGNIDSRSELDKSSDVPDVAEPKLGHNVEETYALQKDHGDRRLKLSKLKKKPDLVSNSVEGETSTQISQFDGTTTKNIEFIDIKISKNYHNNKSNPDDEQSDFKFDTSEKHMDNINKPIKSASSIDMMEKNIECESNDDSNNVKHMMENNVTNINSMTEGSIEECAQNVKRTLDSKVCKTTGDVEDIQLRDYVIKKTLESKLKNVANYEEVFEIQEKQNVDVLRYVGKTCHDVSDINEVPQLEGFEFTSPYEENIESRSELDKLSEAEAAEPKLEHNVEETERRLKLSELKKKPDLVSVCNFVGGEKIRQISQSDETTTKNVQFIDIKISKDYHNNKSNPADEQSDFKLDTSEKHIDIINKPISSASSIDEKELSINENNVECEYDDNPNNVKHILENDEVTSIASMTEGKGTLDSKVCKTADIQLRDYDKNKTKESKLKLVTNYDEVSEIQEKQKNVEVLRYVDNTCHDVSDIIEDIPINEVPQLEGFDITSAYEENIESRSELDKSSDVPEAAEPKLKHNVEETYVVQKIHVDRRLKLSELKKKPDLVSVSKFVEGEKSRQISQSNGTTTKNIEFIDIKISKDYHNNKSNPDDEQSDFKLDTSEKHMDNINKSISSASSIDIMEKEFSINENNIEYEYNDNPNNVKQMVENNKVTSINSMTEGIIEESAQNAKRTLASKVYKTADDVKDIQPRDHVTDKTSEEIQLTDENAITLENQVMQVSTSENEETTMFNVASCGIICSLEDVEKDHQYESERVKDSSIPNEGSGIMSANINAEEVGQHIKRRIEAGVGDEYDVECEAQSEKVDDTDPTFDQLEEVRQQLKLQLTTLRTRKKMDIFQNVKQTVVNVDNLQKTFPATKILGKEIDTKLPSQKTVQKSGSDDLEFHSVSHEVTENTSHLDEKTSHIQSLDNKDVPDVLSEIRSIIKKAKTSGSSGDVQRYMCPLNSNVDESKNEKTDCSSTFTNETFHKSDSNPVVSNPLDDVSPQKTFSSPFVSNSLDEFLVDSKLNVSYTIPKSGAEEGLKNHDYSVDPFPSSTKKEETNETEEKQNRTITYKPKTLAEKRRILEKTKIREEKRLKKQRQQMQNRSYVLFKDKKIYLHSTKLGKCVAAIESTFQPVESTTRKKTSLLSDLYRKSHSSVSYKAGPLSKKHLLQIDCSRWSTEIKKLPIVSVSVMPQFGKPIHPCLLSLFHEWTGEISDHQVDFALTALATPKSDPKIFKFDLNYENRQQKLMVRKKEMKTKTYRASESAYNNINEDVSIVINNLLNYVETKEIADSLIKEDNDFKADSAESIVTVRKRKRSKKHSKTSLELLRLNCKLVRMEAKEGDMTNCNEPYCRLGCVCKSLQCETKIGLHCKKITCIFGCSCPKELNKVVSISKPGDATNESSLLSTNTVSRIEDEAKKNLARVEKEFTQTIIYADGKTIVVGVGNKPRRAARLPKKYSDFFDDDDCIDNVSKKEHQPLVKPCCVSVEKWDFSDITPYCLVHCLYNCYCQGLSRFNSVKEEKLENTLINSCKREEDVLTLGSLLGTSSRSELSSKRQISRYTGRSQRKKKFAVTSDYICYDSYNLDESNPISIFEPNYCARTQKIAQKYRSAKTHSVSATLNDFTNHITEEDLIKANLKETDMLDSDRLKKIIIEDRQKQLEIIEKKPNRKRKQQFHVREDDDEMVKTVLTEKQINKINAVFPGEIIVGDPVCVQKLCSHSKQPSDAYARILPWGALLKGFVSKHINVYCINDMPLRLLLNMGKKIVSHKVLDIETCGNKILEMPLNGKAAWLLNQSENVRDIIRWLLSGSLSSKYRGASLSFLLVETLPGQFEVRGLCTQNQPSNAIEESVLQISDEITEIKHKDMNNEIQSLFITKMNLHYRELVEDGCDDDLTDNLYMWVGLPEVYKVAKWRVIFLKNDFAFLYFKNIKYSIKYSDLVKLAEVAKEEKLTLLIRNLEIRRSYDHMLFGLYVSPTYIDRIFIGPYFLGHEQEDIDTIQYMNETLISTESLSKMKGDGCFKCGHWMYERQYMTAPKKFVKETVDPPVTNTKPLTELRKPQEPPAKARKISPSEDKVIFHNNIPVRIKDCKPRSPSDFNRYIITNIPYFGYLGAFQAENSSILEVSWPFEKKVLEFQNPDHARDFLQERFNQLLQPVPESFKIQVIVLIHLDLREHQPVNSDFLSGHCICGYFGTYNIKDLTEEFCQKTIKMSRQDILKLFAKRANEYVGKKIIELAQITGVQPDSSKSYNLELILDKTKEEIKYQQNRRIRIIAAIQSRENATAKRVKKLFDMIKQLPPNERSIEARIFNDIMRLRPKRVTATETIEIDDDEVPIEDKSKEIDTTDSFRIIPKTCSSRKRKTTTPVTQKRKIAKLEMLGPTLSTLNSQSSMSSGDPSSTESGLIIEKINR